ncbi:MAG: pyruvate kinase alpha/beta domain-containing protein [Candidatus Methanomethylicia archaeon]
MSMIEKTIVYFSSPGENNTETVLALARRRAEELGIKDVVVASVIGETGVKASKIFKGFNLIIVTHHTGFKEPGKQELSEENRKVMETNVGRIFTGTHVFANVERAIRNKFNTVYPVEIMAQTLRFFGEGMKVAVEIAAMAADAGLIPIDRDVISIAGTGKGADTAIVIKPANSTRIFDMIIREIIAKPRDKM